MSLGVVMLVHTDFDRAEQVARHWHAAGCPVVIHVDRSVHRARFTAFRDALSALPRVRFSPRHRCEWGTWGIVAATQEASELMLAEFSEVRHVYLASGSCLPLRPVEELRDYLAVRPNTDFIESATTADVPWTVGGLDTERFTLRFPFSWKSNRMLFDAAVEVQRRLRLHRRPPRELIPHMGSQWWCLTRQTLSAILQDPERARFERYFKLVWIPDESYFQTLSRLYARDIESRSLTLSKFDFQGKPHIFYDDHLQLLRRSDCFVARKIWPRADKLYRAFLTDSAGAMSRTEPNPGKIDRVFSKAVYRRTRGRPGLYMQSRFPNENWENGVTAAPYSVFEGFSDLFEDFEGWLGRVSGMRVHGHLYGPERAEFAEGHRSFNGALSDDRVVRDYRPTAFLTNLIWNTRGERQAFMYGPRDNQAMSWQLARDPNAQIAVITGAWILDLYESNENFGTLRRRAADLQKIEVDHLYALRSPYAKARVQIWSMAEFIENPMENLQSIIDAVGARQPRRMTEAPRMKDLTNLPNFLQSLKNQGMHPHLVGDFPSVAPEPMPERPRRKPYLVK